MWNLLSLNFCKFSPLCGLGHFFVPFLLRISVVADGCVLVLTRCGGIRSSWSTISFGLWCCFLNSGWYLKVEFAPVNLWSVK